MHHDHIGIPKFIERGFSNNGKVYCYDLHQDKVYGTNIDRLGTKNNYYEDDVEKKLLAEGVEKEFSNFYNDFCGTINTDALINILNANTELVTQFFSFMFTRAKKTLETVNKESITSQLFGDLSHSDLLRVQSIINTNPLGIIGDNYKFFPLINFSNEHFINNSLGFGIMINKDKEISIVILLNRRLGILVSNNQEFGDSELFYIEPEGYKKAITINNCICKLEKNLGNGFIFGESKEIVEKYTEYIKKLV